MQANELEVSRAEFEELRALARIQGDKILALEAARRVSSRRALRATAAALAVAGLCVTWSASPEARAQFGLTLTGLNTRLTAVEAKTAPLSVSGSTLTISGVNVAIVDGTGSTESFSGLGNLTIGYNALQGFGLDERTGSHNLILGDDNNYSSFGGLVVGQYNSISGEYATVTGGADNTAGGAYSSVSGGLLNTASGELASVSGGFFNAASGAYSSVSGGNTRSATGIYQWVGGSYTSPN